MTRFISSNFLEMFASLYICVGSIPLLLPQTTEERNRLGIYRYHISRVKCRMRILDSLHKKTTEDLVSFTPKVLENEIDGRALIL